MGEPVRIQKLLATWGIASRRAIEKMIDNGQLKVDNQPLTEKGMLVDPDNPPAITINGKVVTKPANEGFSIYVLNKPEGIVTTLADELGRKNIAGFLPAGKRLYPIGRLDRDSTGLLLVTDHGELTHRLLHPSFKVEKEYIIKIAGAPLTHQECESFRAGVILDDGKTSPCKLLQLENTPTYSVTIKEGKKRQIRRMFAAFGRKVISLNRIRFGPIKLSDLQAGEIRCLTAKEKADLLEAAGLKN